MLRTYFEHPFTLNKLRSGPAGPHLDDFASHLTCKGYSRDTIRRHLRAVGHLSAWAQTSGLTIRNLDTVALEQFRQDLESNGSLRYPSGYYTNTFVGAKCFVTFLQATGIVPALASNAPPALLTEFCNWMWMQRGVTETTLDAYCPVILDLLQTLGDQPECYSAKTLRTFTLERASRHGNSKARIVVTSVRVFLRFLTAVGRCLPELQYAIPTIACWRRSSLPSYLSAEDIERLIATCESKTPREMRDRAVLLLLARLGLRARDITALKLSDLEWHEGALRVCGKNRRETRLPLPQEIGEAIWAYLTHHRPQVNTESVFITVKAPFVPLSRRLVSQIVAHAIRRAGIKTSSRGARLLRHSAATAMLRQGVSLETIGAVLRHASIETTMVYAKVDTVLLRQVAMPWLEVEPC